MLMKSKLIEQVKVVPCLMDRLTAALTAGTSVGQVVDRNGFNSAVAILMIGGASATITDSFTAVVRHSDDSTTTGTWTNYNTAEVSLTLGGTAIATGDEAFVNLVGAKRYINISVTIPGLGQASADISVAFVLGDAVSEPAE